MRLLTPFALLLTLIISSCGKSEVREHFDNYSATDSTLVAISQEWVTDQYEIEFKNRFLSKKIRIRNFGDYGDMLKATVDGLNFTVPEQQLSNGNLIDGEGYFSGDSVYFEYYYTNEFGEPFVGRGYGIRN